MFIFFPPQLLLFWLTSKCIDLYCVFLWFACFIFDDIWLLFHHMCKLFNQIRGELFAFFAGYWYILVLALKWNIFDPPENKHSILCKCPVGGSNETSRMPFAST